jgi:hypothetical protein
MLLGSCPAVQCKNDQAINTCGKPAACCCWSASIVMLGTPSFQNTYFTLQLSNALLIQLNATD